MSSNKQIIFLKNKTIPVDNYETFSEHENYDSIQFVPLLNHIYHAQETLTLLKNSEYLSNLDYVIVTSQRTVECLYECVIPYLSEGEREMLFNKVVFTVGPATGEFLRRVGFHNVVGDDTGNGDLLSDLITRELAGYSGEMLFLVGVIRRDIIKKKLNAANIRVREVETYETSVLENNVDRLLEVVEDDEETDCWVVVFSPQGTNEILHYLKCQESSESIQIACIGPTTEKFLLRNGIRPAVVSPKPDPISLLMAIKQTSKKIN